MKSITNFCHAELDSASMTCLFYKQRTRGKICPWTLKQVQGDVVLGIFA